LFITQEAERPAEGVGRDKLFVTLCDEHGCVLRQGQNNWCGSHDPDLIPFIIT
jgi:hypothetical protein